RDILVCEIGSGGGKGARQRAPADRLACQPSEEGQELLACAGRGLPAASQGWKEGEGQTGVHEGSNLDAQEPVHFGPDGLRNRCCSLLPPYGQVQAQGSENGLELGTADPQKLQRLFLLLQGGELPQGGHLEKAGNEPGKRIAAGFHFCYFRPRQSFT